MAAGRESRVFSVPGNGRARAGNEGRSLAPPDRESGLSPCRHRQGAASKAGKLIRISRRVSGDQWRAVAPGRRGLVKQGGGALPPMACCCARGLNRFRRRKGMTSPRIAVFALRRYRWALFLFLRGCQRLDRDVRYVHAGFTGVAGIFKDQGGGFLRCRELDGFALESGF